MAMRNWVPPQGIKILQSKGKFKISDNASSFDYFYGDTDIGAICDVITSLSLDVTYPSGKKIVFESKLEKGSKPYNEKYPDLGNVTCYKDTNYNISLDEVGEYQLRFILIHYSESVRPHLRTTNRYTATTYIFVNPGNTELKPYSLADTIRRLLNLTPTRMADEPPKYTFDPVQLEEYDREESPEFAFTGHTLFEALLMIAQYKGAFPVLDENNVISFRKLWNGEQKTEAELPATIDEISSSDINQYCTHLDTEVQNLVGVNNSQTGSIVEPYAGGYKTTRAASGSEISQDTVVISTDYNQYQHIKEEIGYINREMPANNDLTAYMYESGDYYALADKGVAYPASKAYALQWEQMGKNITEIAHRIEAKGSIAKAFTQPAIANIIQVKTGIKYDTGIVGYLQKLVGIQDGNSFADLMFRTTYIPVINSRVKQYKEYFANFNYDGSLKYNQTAELVDSELYGEHLKQLIRKIGNATRRCVYIFDNLDLVPKVGTVVDGYSVYDVQMSIRENEVVATISYVKYAELSQYIGVKNPWKDSDVSTNKCYNRSINYGEFLLFTSSGSVGPTGKTFISEHLEELMPSSTPKALTCAMATGYMKYDTPLNTVLLPVISLAMGNSIMFQWGYQNNYSAGYMSEGAPDGATSVISGTKYNRAQKAVKYADAYGKLETLSYYIMPSGPVPNGSNIGWQKDSGVEYSVDYVMKQIGHSLPLKPDKLVGWQGDKYVSVEKLDVEKNSSEALTFITQYHFCTDNPNFIIGSGLANFCPLIGGSAVDLAVYGFAERINIFNRHISIQKNADLLLKGQISVMKFAGDRLLMRLPKDINATNEDGSYKYNSWAYVGRANSKENFQIIFGENRDLRGKEFSSSLFLTPMHKLEDFI